MPTRQLCKNCWHCKNSDFHVLVSPKNYYSDGVTESWVEAGKLYTLTCVVPKVKPEGKVVWVVGGEEKATTSTCDPNPDSKTCRLTGSTKISFMKTQDDGSLICRVLYSHNDTFWDEEHYKTVLVYSKYIFLLRKSNLFLNCLEINTVYTKFVLESW